LIFVLRILLRINYLVADEVVDKTTTQELAKTFGDLVESGAFDHLNKEDTAFHAISKSRMGYYGDEQLAMELFEALRA
jgi:hypothetical protein